MPAPILFGCRCTSVCIENAHCCAHVCVHCTRLLMKLYMCTWIDLYVGEILTIAFQHSYFFPHNILNGSWYNQSIRFRILSIKNKYPPRVGLIQHDDGDAGLGRCSGTDACLRHRAVSHWSVSLSFKFLLLRHHPPSRFSRCKSLSNYCCSFLFLFLSFSLSLY